MVELNGEIKKWGNSAALRINKSDLKSAGLRMNQRVRAIIIPKGNAIQETFGIFKNLRKKSGQEMKDEIRKELHGM